VRPCCAHGLPPRYCTIRSCPHWDGIEKTHDLKNHAPKRVHIGLTRDRSKRMRGQVAG
jgi:hypothetical protein